MFKEEGTETQSAYQNRDSELLQKREILDYDVLMEYLCG